MNNHRSVVETSIDMGSFLSGVLFGALAGAGTMFLLAPQSGARTRAQIQRKSGEIRDQATRAVEDGLNQTRATAQQFQADVYEKAHEIQQGGQALLDEQRARLSAAVAAGKTAVQAAQH